MQRESIKLTKNGGAKFLVATEQIGSDAFVSKKIEVFDERGYILETKSCETNSTECDKYQTKINHQK